jgi:hypothetical protein
MHETTLIGDRTIASNEDVICYGLSEYFDLEDIRDNFLGLPIDIGVDESNVVVARDYISKG